MSAGLQTLEQQDDSDRQGVTRADGFATESAEAPLQSPAADGISAPQPPVLALQQPPIITSYVQPTYPSNVPQYYIGSSAVQAYPSGPGAFQHPVIMLTAGMRVIYTSRSNGQKYPASVVERTQAGWLLQLDVDGGLKEVEDVEIWRVEHAPVGPPPQLVEQVEAQRSEEQPAKVTKGRQAGRPRRCCC
eukprot:TRINITY_DN11695_c0_g1_i4.p1 TRINITY_DN11695_c0_g1~~TRINITY_DN11695_c0_g1_i4.p1  ORF type:complete len:189 (+),score=38.17 TRINITY_DN11695_c0_g1_i4:180-746(+)